MQVECITDSLASNNPLHTQTSFPYWVNTLLAYEPVENSEEFQTRRYQLSMAYIIGTLTTQYDGLAVTRLYTDEPTIMDYFAAHRGLTTTATTNNYHIPPNYLAPEFCRITRSQGVGVFQISGVGIQVFGTVFNLMIPFEVPIAIKS